MTSQTGRRWGRLLAGVVLSLLVIVLAAPAVARASCGDYVVLGSRSTHAPGHSEMATGTQQGESLPAVPVPKPCSGPGCNRGTPLPLPASPTISSVQAEDWLCLPDRLLPTDPQLVAFLMDPPAPSSEGRNLSIYHPPRSSHS
jgi:hypothetical protein